MRHVVVNRVTVALLGLFVACAGLFARRASAPRAPRAPGAPAAAPLFELRCASCHEKAGLAEALRARGGAARRGELEAFLRGHGSASPDENRRILDELAAF